MSFLPLADGLLLAALNSGVLRRSKWSGIETAADDLPASSAPPPLTNLGPMRRRILRRPALLERRLAAEAITRSTTLLAIRD